MTGEVRLVGEGALNLTGAAGMAAGGSSELWPRRWLTGGARAPGVCLDLGGCGKVQPLPKVTGAPREAEGCLLGRLAKARGLSGIPLVAARPPLPNVTGVGPKAVCCEDGQCPRFIRSSLVAGNAAMDGSDRNRVMRRKAVDLRSVGEDAEAPGSSGLPGLREIRFWLMCSGARGLLVLI